VEDPRLADHAVGLELELAELVEQRERAMVQGRLGDASSLQREIDAVQLELVETAEELATSSHHLEMHGAVAARSA
jgi:hypothetical protein